MRRSTSGRTRYRWVLLMALLSGAIPSPGFAKSDAQEWLYRTEVVFESAESTWLVRLADGSEVLVGLGGPPFCKGVTGWASGRALVYAYNTVVGTVLIDSKTGCRMGVPLPKPHPIDLIEVPPEGRTRYSLWDAELNRVYKAALEVIGSSKGGDFGVVPGPEVVKALRESQRRWISFRDAEEAALKALHAGGGQVGWQQEAKGMTDLVRQRARSLVLYLLTER